MNEQAEVKAVGAPEWTPGPWRANTRPFPTEGVTAAYAIDSADYFHIATGQSQEHLGTGILGAQCRANAQLIAAAPELYEALTCLVYKGNLFRNTVIETRGVRGMDEHDEALQNARAVLAKARGEVQS